MLNLKKEYLVIVCKILRKYVSESVVWAYGSRVSGGAHEGSDLDLVIINSQAPNTPDPKLSALREAFSESDIPILVDVMDWARIPEPFREQIKQVYEVIQ